jgi:MFS family permease
VAHARCPRNWCSQPPLRSRARGADVATAEPADNHPRSPGECTGGQRGNRGCACWDHTLHRGAFADDPLRRRTVAVGGYASTPVLSSLIGVATSVWQVGVLRAGAWASRGLRGPARSALLADLVPPGAYGRAYGFERLLDNLGAVGGPLLALGLVAALGVRFAILVSVVPGLLATVAIVYAIRRTPRATVRARQPVRVQVRPLDSRLLTYAAPRLGYSPECRASETWRRALSLAFFGLRSRQRSRFFISPAGWSSRSPCSARWLKVNRADNSTTSIANTTR